MKRKKISSVIRQMVFARDGWMCVYCGKTPEKWTVEHCQKPYRINVIPLGFEIDHIIPYIETQDNSIFNLVTSCCKCNSKKSNRRWKLAKNHTTRITSVFKRT